MRSGETSGSVENRGADSDDRDLLENVRPSDWRNPTPSGRYNMVVIGAGTAGLVTAAGAAGLGARVALVERDRLGGDCLNFGCVPSKALLRSARAAAHARHASRYGIRIEGTIETKFGAVMERMRALRAEIARNDSAARFRELGVDVYFGAARFVSPDSVVVEGTVLRFSRACIATGARASVPEIPGLREAGYLTNETLFSLTRLPSRLAVIGGGPIGCEMAQAFARLGARVCLIEAGARLLQNDEVRASSLIEHVLREDGVDVRTSASVSRVEGGAGEKRLFLQDAGGVTEIAAEEILVATGRTPNVETLGLEVAGIEYASGGVRVDGGLRTTNRRVFAAGDVCVAHRFTHAADACARVVIRNALFFGRSRYDASAVPWCTYTDPEVAHVGLTERGAAEKGVAIRSVVIEAKDVDRARLEGEERGFLTVHVKSGSDRIVGATMVGAHAGETISELTVAMSAGIGLARLADTIHCYPTRAEAVRKAGDAYNRSRLTPGVRALLVRLMALRR